MPLLLLLLLAAAAVCSVGLIYSVLYLHVKVRKTFWKREYMHSCLYALHFYPQ